MISEQEETAMDKWECMVCGYIYDPAENDNVSFENLPDDWVCPDCGVGKDMFEKVG
jgi:rubredoxin